MRTEHILHFTIAGTVGSAATVATQFAMTGDWSPVAAGGVGVAFGLLYLVTVLVLPRPQWLPLLSGKIVQWLKAYSQAMLFLVLSVILLAIIITRWPRDELSAMDQVAFEQPNVAQPIENRPIEEQTVVERTTVEEQELKDADQALRTHPVCPVGVMPDLVNCDNLDGVVEHCGLNAVRSGELTHPGRAGPRLATWSFRGCLLGRKMSWETCNKGEKNCYLFEDTGEKGFRGMRDFEGN